MTSLTHLLAPSRMPAASRLFDGALRALGRRYTERRAADLLRSMPDSRLRDLGISRDQIDAVVKGMVRR